MSDTSKLGLGKLGQIKLADVGEPDTHKPDSGVLLLAAGDAQTFTFAATSGALTLKGDAPSLLTFAPLASVAIRLRSDGVDVLTATPSSGRMRFLADAPTVIPVHPSSGRERLLGAGPYVTPVRPISGRLLLRGFAPRAVYPLELNVSGVLRLRGDRPTVSHQLIVSPFSGLIRLRADAPTVTPLATVPTGMSISAAAR